MVSVLKDDQGATGLGTLVVFMVLSALISLAIWLFVPSYDVNNVDPSLRALERPYQSVIVEYYLDGGSIGLFVSDKAGKSASFGLRVTRENDKDVYKTLFIGDPRKTNNPGTRVSLNSDTKNFIIEIMDRYGRLDMNKKAALMKIRGNLKDWLRIYFPIKADEYDPLRGL